MKYKSINNSLNLYGWIATFFWKLYGSNTLFNHYQKHICSYLQLINEILVAQTLFLDVLNGLLWNYYTLGYHQRTLV